MRSHGLSTLRQLTAKRAERLKQPQPLQPTSPSIDLESFPDWPRFEHYDAEADQRAWLHEQFGTLSDHFDIVLPSEWAEQKRYLAASMSSMPGVYRYEVTPYLREIIDCLSTDSPVRQVSIMKGAQLGFTTGVLENYIGYCIEHVKTAPMMMITAEDELAKLRMDGYIIPMLTQSDLAHLIKSSDEMSNRKTGKTDKRIEWVGSGFMIPLGAKNAAKLRSIAIQILLRDEIDGWPDAVGKDGDPIRLSFKRTAGYETSRKVLDISTPLEQPSKIESLYKKGDQRQYFVCCLKCGHSQTLRWHRVNEETGEETGITWKLDDHGQLVEDSVRYLCEHCAHPHRNDDKVQLLSPDFGAEWRPTEPPSNPHHRSYHLSALYAPVGMHSWASTVRSWLEAWDVPNHRPKEIEKLRVFYNTELGKSFKPVGERVTFGVVSPHRRDYMYGEIPNHFCAQHAGSPVLVLTAAVDVHAENLKVAVFGWTRGRRTFLIDYFDFEGDTEDLSNKYTWGELRTLIQDKIYIADDGKRYPVLVTLIDSGYRTDQVYEFAGEYQHSVFPIKGRQLQTKNATVREFSKFETKLGQIAYNITVDLYKERWSAALRRQWDGLGIMPIGHFNVPENTTDVQLRELTKESKRPKKNKVTGRIEGFEWHRPRGSANELWDLLIYNACALDLIAWEVCLEQMGLKFVNWEAFFDRLEHEELYFESK